MSPETGVIEPKEGPDYGHPYDLKWHGPWTMDLAERCVCGLWRFFGDAAHDVSPPHIAGRLRDFTDSEIEDAIAALDNGLGWAASEGMHSYRWYNDDELLAIVRTALTIARRHAR